MKISFIADYRSPIARQWIDHVAIQHDVHVISSYPLPTSDRGPLASLQVVPLGLAGLAGSNARQTAGGARSRPNRPRPWHLTSRRLGSSLPGLRRALGPADAMRQSRRLQHAIERTEPDLVHAMRIPYEGMAAARAVPPQIPFLLSIWGNDLTLHAPANRLMRNATRHALERADALQCDCGRDVRLAEAWGWVPTRPSIVVPGIGGVDVNVFHPGKSTLREQLGLDPGVPIVLNPRGLREYVCWDSYLEAIPVIAARRPDVHFVCTGMSESAAVKRRVADLGITTRLTLLPPLGHAAMADVFRAADVSVSPSVHDGTPNTLLEAMASGALPVVGRLDSVLEWIEDGQNGLVCDPTDPDSVATAVIEALENARLRARATTINGSLIEERADFGRSMDAVDAFYRTVIQAGTSVVSDKAS